MYEANLDIVFCREKKGVELGWIGWSAHLLVECKKIRFSGNEAQRKSALAHSRSMGTESSLLVICILSQMKLSPNIYYMGLDSRKPVFGMLQVKFQFSS